MNIFLFLISQFNTNNTSNKMPVRLDKKEKTYFETYIRKAYPYVIFACVIILCVLLFIALVKYGHSFSTEANTYEHLQQITIG